MAKVMTCPFVNHVLYESFTKDEINVFMKLLREFNVEEDVIKRIFDFM